MKNKAFTLIELLVVVLIIGILAAIAVPQYQKAVDKSRFTKLVLYTDAITKAQKTYFLAKGSYAINLNDLDVKLPTGHNCSMVDNGNMIWTNCNLYKGEKVLVSLQKILVPATLNRMDCCSYSITNYEGDTLCSEFANSSSSYDGDTFHCFLKYN